MAKGAKLIQIIFVFAVCRRMVRVGLYALLVLVAVLLITPLPAMAQETQPGDSCTAAQLHHMRQVSGPENPGTGYFLVCNGSVWKAITSWDTGTGRLLARVGTDNTACTTPYEGAIRYQSACIEVCDGTNWTSMCGAGGGGGDTTPNAFDFSDVSNAALNAVIASNIVLISGIDTASDVVVGGAGSPEYRICADNACSSVIQNWGSALGSITNGQYLQVRLTSAATATTTRTATPISVGTVSADWAVTTTAVKLVFVTSTSYTGSLGGVSGADSKCSTRATAGGLSGTFKAWIADRNLPSAPSVTFAQANIPYVLVNGTQVADNWADLIDGSLDNPISINELGGAVTADVWTNVNANGSTKNTGATGTCSDWAVGSGSWGGGYGVTSSTAGGWTNTGNTAGCDPVNRLYCFQQ